MLVSFWLEELLGPEEQEEAGGVHKRSKLRQKIGRTWTWNHIIFNFGSADGIIGEKLAVYDSVN